MLDTHFRSFWTFIPSFQLAIKSLLDHPFRLTMSSNPRHNSHKKASIHGSCSDFSFPVHFQLRAHGSCHVTRPGSMPSPLRSHSTNSRLSLPTHLQYLLQL